MTSDLLVLGAGASGLMAALTAARRGFQCTVVDHAPVMGQKLRLAGGGKGNVTNLTMHTDWFTGEKVSFAATALRRCPPSLVLSWLKDFGIPWEEREASQIFCTVPAARLVEQLVSACRQHGVRFLMRQNILEAGQSVSAAGSLFHVRTGEELLTVPRLLIATGSPAWPDAGATDLGMRLARQFGHRIVPVRPVLVPLVCPETWPLHGLAGLSVPAAISVPTASGKRLLKGSLLFTHKGLSGPAALHASCFWRPGQAISINVLPENPVMELMHQPENGKLSVLGLCRRMLPDRLAALLVPADLAPRKVAQLGKKDRERIAVALHEHTVTPTRTEGMRHAEAAAGGVDVEEVNPKTMESRCCPGLYFSGEVLDITGLLGGYNLHWAWSSAKAAGEAIR